MTRTSRAADIAVPALALLIALLALLAYCGLAFGQEAAPPPTPKPGDTVADISPIVGAIRDGVSAIVSLLIGGLAAWVGRKWVSKQHMQVFQTAVENAAGLVLSRLAGALPTQIDVRSVVLADGIEYVQKAAPDALKHFGITQAKIEETIRAKLGPMLIEAQKAKAETVAASAATKAAPLMGS